MGEKARSQTTKKMEAAYSKLIQKQADGPLDAPLKRGSKRKATGGAAEEASESDVGGVGKAPSGGASEKKLPSCFRSP